MKPKPIMLLALLCFAVSTNAQFTYPYIEDFGEPEEFTLGLPNTNEGTQLIPLGIDLWEGDDVNTIHFGKVPPNSQDKPVIVFVHGYASNAHVWFEGNDNMYKDVYYSGYRSAFVSLTPNRHMWTNGNMLAKIINRITDYYGVEKVSLVGWSKGGVDIDAAIVHFGSNDKVSNVFTLSTPHFGTGIAELANSILLSLVNIIFMQDNDATLSLQRGYMNYFRSVTDGHSNNSVPYVTLGAYGNGPLARLSIPQGYLYLTGGSKSSGGNDGVVPYSSSRRPGGQELFSGLKKKYFLGIPYYTGPNETDLDHYEVTRGIVWPYIQTHIYANGRANANNTPYDYNPNASVVSRAQIITNKAGMNQFIINEADGEVSAVVLGAGKLEILKEGSIVKSFGETRMSIPQQFFLGNLESGIYSVRSNQDIAVVIFTDGGVEAQLSTGLRDKLVYNTGEPVKLELNLISEDNILKNVWISGTMTRTSDLNLNRVSDAPIPVRFSVDENKYTAVIDDNLPAGVYSITVSAKGQNYKRDVTTSIAVVGYDFVEENHNLMIEAYPNPTAGTVNFQLDIKQSDARLNIYDIRGQLIQSFDFSGKTGKTNQSWHPKEKGLYIAELKDGNVRSTIKVIVKD